MGKPKKLSAMDLLVKSDAFKPAISQSSTLSRNAVANLHDGTPVEIAAAACRPWKLADRPVGETSHKEDLIRSFRQAGVGQIQPIVVRSVKDPDAPEIQYEVICGRVRWLAAKELGIPIQAIVRELDDREAYLVMSAENRQRKNLSDYAKAKSYQSALALGLFDTAQQLAEAEGISKSKLSQYLGFAELPEAMSASFANIAKIPYRLGYEINKACKVLGEAAILPLIPKIESGELSRNDVQLMQTRIIDSTAQTKTIEPTESNLDADDDLNTNPTQHDEAGATPLRPSTPHQANASNLPQESQLKKSFLSASGRKLFTYNQASRGWLIRIAPDISMRMDEALMLEFGKLLEAHLEVAQGSAPD